MTTGLHCHGCGSTNVTFHPQNRIVLCNQCGKEEYYSRSAINANNKVIHSKKNAIEFFLQGNYALSAQYAREAINISLDNTPALFILAYYDDFVLGRAGAMASALKRILATPLEHEELEDLMTLFLATPYKLIEHEETVIRIIGLNFQSEADKPALQAFVDKLCPYLIEKRPSMSFLTPEMAGVYRELAGYCDIPKTCFALLKAIRSNPDSPFAGNTFYLQSKSQYFFEHFVKPVHQIISAMGEGQVKEKFLNAYEQVKNDFKDRASI